MRSNLKKKEFFFFEYNYKILEVFAMKTVKIVHWSKKETRTKNEKSNVIF